jgi:hypothetical protein
MDGCETNAAADPNNCGTCGNACVLPNATASCVGGACQVGVCSPGYFNCNNLSADGCEVYVLGDANNCGACGNVCSFPNASGTCSNGTCQFGACNPGYADCNNNPADGCEVYVLGDANNCGACGNVCTFPNATGTCSSGTCQLNACNAGYADCNNNPADGCEVNASNNANNCGGCGVVCSSNNITPSCGGGLCNGSCNTGFLDCNGNKQTDGCEVNVSNNVNNCGGCGIVCSSNNITPSCGGGVCNGTCSTGFLDCNGNKQTDGCEVNSNTNNNNCGTCGHVCPQYTYCSGGGCYAP